MAGETLSLIFKGGHLLVFEVSSQRGTQRGALVPAFVVDSVF